jgi:hypothetical protein
LGDATKISKEYWKEGLNQMVQVGGDIYM